MKERDLMFVTKVCDNGSDGIIKFIFDRKLAITMPLVLEMNDVSLLDTW